MGKRKERRLAAMIGAGRRVKLDLFAEPSGESGGSSAQDELGGEMDPRHRAGSPNSPSSSGKQQENPLSLLGQYSDDELDEESSETLDPAIVEKSTADNDEQGKVPISTENEVMANNPSMDLDAEKDRPHDLDTNAIPLDALQNLEYLDGREIDSAVTGDSCKEVVSMEETSLPGTADVQMTGNLISSWKVVLHEESNQYYYWNTLTGETSWVVPDVLAQGTELTDDQKNALDIEGRNSALFGAHEHNASLNMEVDGSISLRAIDQAGNVINETQEMHEPGAQVEEQNDGNKDEGLEEKRRGLEANQSEVKISSVAASALGHKTSSLGDSVSPWESGDALLSNGDARCVDSEKYKCNPMVHEEDDTDDDLSSSVLKHSENLLNRLRSLEGSRSYMQGHGWISKYIWQVETRLSDIKSLLPFGSSLLPFWVHCERQLKELEDAIDNEVSQILKYAQSCEAESKHNSQGIERSEIEADGDEKEIVCSAFENSHASADDVTLTAAQKDSKHEAANGYVFPAVAIDYPAAHSGSGSEGNGGVHEAAQLSELTPETAVHAGEDVDMDVDMEVEDEIPASASVTRDSLAEECCATEEQPIHPNAPAGQESFVPPEAYGIPPPPDDDWIPPPPPDNELVPPPPPDDPSDPSYPPPPTYFETIQPLSYTENYNLSYPGSNFEYYGQANSEFTTYNVHGHAEGCQVAVPHPPLYYEALPSTYPGAAPAIVNPVEPVVYYDLQDGAVLPGPVASGAKSSVLHGEYGHENLGSDQISSVVSRAEASCTSLTVSEGGVYAVNVGTEKALMEVPFTSAAIQAPAAVSLVQNAPGSSTTVVAPGSSTTVVAPGSSTTVVAPVSVATKPTATNVQSKVSRSKKRTVAAVSTLKSNKKVSSLVDKWKAAKEELHEDEEEEPENAYEMLEKKRQREIEEWRAQQIASGEAKVNANFQPLGGDWRERVKRKRAQLNREAVQNSSGSPTDGHQQPDLNKLSRDLPSGWQVYWDESTKQVYYGNAITSETTWTRPTK